MELTLYLALVHSEIGGQVFNAQTLKPTTIHSKYDNLRQDTTRRNNNFGEKKCQNPKKC